jgi:hypothetical protein
VAQNWSKIATCNVGSITPVSSGYFTGDMGGVFIKAGQFISTRADIFPEEIINEMAGLQNEVPTIPYDQI